MAEIIRASVAGSDPCRSLAPSALAKHEKPVRESAEFSEPELRSEVNPVHELTARKTEKESPECFLLLADSIRYPRADIS